MPYSAHETESAVTLEPSVPADAAVVWLHGLGADGYDFVPIVEELRLPETFAVRFIFPHAPMRPVTINNGFVMRAWYDIKGFDATVREDEDGVRESERIVRNYIAEQRARGIAAERIVIAGFSQGGAIALHTALRYEEPLAGVIALSTYLPLHAMLPNEASAVNRPVPILMCHGMQDGIVPIQMGAMSREYLTQLGYRIEWHTYPMQHSVCLDEINDISRWLQTRLA
ncbi:MAG TPA: dienelactone hydrolase family protein [Steroidobacteraceae bacterium]